MRSFARLLAVLLAVLVLTPFDPVTSVASAEVHLIAHPSVPDDTLAVSDVQRIYLGKRSRWSDRSAVVPSMLSGGDVHETFVSEMLGRSVSRFDSFWKQAVFTGKGIPPKSFDSEEAILAFVASTPGAIGYVSDTVQVDGVRIIVVE